MSVGGGKRRIWAGSDKGVWASWVGKKVTHKRRGVREYR